MTTYIRSISGISPGFAPGAPGLPVLPAILPGNRVAAIEPDYAGYFDTKQIRRTSRIVRMGVAAALQCLRDAGLAMPEALVTGTAYGCLEDTGIFLERLIGQQEDMLSPTAFIQSTHNTVGAQIALLLQCTAYNNTYVHRGLSFESALLDAMLLLADREAGSVLVGAVDEITTASHLLLERFGLNRHRPVGEGAFFFLLSAESSPDTLARFDGLQTIHGPLTRDALEAGLDAFLAAHQLDRTGVDHLLWGMDHPPAFTGAKSCTDFKSLCGEYPTATSFALGLAVTEIKSGRAEKVLIGNSYLDYYHSFMLVSHAVK